MKRPNEAVLMIGGSQKDSIGYVVAQKLEQQYGQVITADMNNKDGDLYIDVTSPKSVDLAVEQAMDLARSLETEITACVYAAGFNRMGSLQEYSYQEFRRTLDVNLTGVFLVAQALANQLEISPHTGDPFKFLALGSNTAFVAKTKTFAYGASKAGLEHMLKCMHREMAPQGMEFASLDFGIVMDSGMTEITVQQLVEQRGISELEATELLLKNVPTGKPVTRTEIANWIEFILLNRTSIGGNSLRFDGGQQQG